MYTIDGAMYNNIGKILVSFILKVNLLLLKLQYLELSVCYLFVLPKLLKEIPHKWAYHKLTSKA